MRGSAPELDERSPRDVPPTVTGRAHRRWTAGGLAALGLLACVLAGLSVTAGPAGALRAVATVTFLLLGPGWAVAGFLRPTSAVQSWAVAAAVGSAVGAIVATAMMRLQVWHPVGALVVVAVLCVPVLLRHALVRR